VAHQRRAVSVAAQGFALEQVLVMLLSSVVTVLAIPDQ
jgi:hypothetical protein